MLYLCELFATNAEFNPYLIYISTALNLYTVVDCISLDHHYTVFAIGEVAQPL